MDNSSPFSVSPSYSAAEDTSCCGFPVNGKVPWQQQQQSNGMNTMRFPLQPPVHRSQEEEEKQLIDDAALARELNELSFEEREEVFDDIHAVAKLPAESPEILQQGLKEMEESFELLLPSRRKNLNRALFLRPKLQDDKKFKLMFLRAELYDPGRAADRMARYFDMKCELFGEEKISKRITIEDLSGDDLNVIKSGVFVVLPTKDPAGRPLTFSDHTKMDFSRSSVDNMLRALWYLVETFSYDDDRAQKMGFCSIMYSNATGKKMKRFIPFPRITEICRRMGNMITCLPCRLSGGRACTVLRNAGFEFFLYNFRLTIGKFSRLRLTTYTGSEIELEYSILSVGVSCAEGLFQNAQKGDTSYHEAFVQRRIEIDKTTQADEAAEEAKSGLVLYPNSNDVLIGRGAPYKFFPGNQRWEQLIQSHLKRYADSTTNFEKTCIAMETVKMIHEDGNGRFLQRTSEGWKSLDDDSARGKAVRAFRARMKY